ncbi:MAG: hypothetical protein JJE52_11805 [Acidimicrobiia bacterium]|nr:hypothetical protein [Acidimicrobiia bacterium]
MIFPHRHILVPSLLALAVLAGCGDDPEASGAGGAAPSDSPASSLPSSDLAGTGRGQLTIGDEGYAFDVDICALHPVQHEGREYDLYVSGSGEVDAGVGVVSITCG